MSMVTKDQLAGLQAQPDRIRNICILAHIDHGKTTLSDSLLASNGIISARMAGKLRFLDDRPDEQQRGITMMSSAISLLFRRAPEDEYLINLVDSPGHVDFNSEVSTAVRLCDGGLVLIDAVEGVSTQTFTVLRQAWVEQVKPILVLNKIDRLILELQMTPDEAHYHLQRLVEQANAVMGMLFRGDLAAIDDFARIYSGMLGINVDLLRRTLWGDWYLDSKKKRVVGRSQAGNRLKPMFVNFVLENLWAVYNASIVSYDQPKLEKIVKALSLRVNPADLASKDTRFVLQSIMGQWLPLSRAVLGMVVQSLPSPASSQNDRTPVIVSGSQSAFNRMKKTLPAESLEVISSIEACTQSPDAPCVVYIAKVLSLPRSSLPDRRRVILTAAQLRERNRQRAALLAAAAADNPGAENEQTVSLDDIKAQQQEAEARRLQEAEEKLVGQCGPNGDVLVGFGRVFSGTLRAGQEIYVLGPKYDPRVALAADGDNAADSSPDGHHQAERVVISRLFLVMGRELEELDEAPAGNLVGIIGIAGQVLKSATLSSSRACPSLAALHMQVSPIVRVALEPSYLPDMPKLIEGLRMLARADPAIEVYVQDTGEHVLATTGELHLERCMVDLREQFARGINIDQSPPLVPYRETVIGRQAPNDFYPAGEAAAHITDMDDPEHEPAASRIHTCSVMVRRSNVVRYSTNDGQVTVVLRAVPLPEDITRALNARSRHAEGLDGAAGASLDLSTPIEEKIRGAFKAAGGPWADYFDRVMCIGPSRTGTNLLISTVPGHKVTCAWAGANAAPAPSAAATPSGAYHGQFDPSIISGFQMTCASGPLCEEPLYGVAFILDEVIMNTDAAGGEEDANGISAVGGSDAPAVRASNFTSGQLISTVREACREAFLSCGPRLMLAIYSCVIQATSEVLGRVYSVIGRCHGRILSEQMRPGTDSFIIRAILPVAESFGFASEIRSRTSGVANPMLVFSGFELLDTDPFWKPTTQEEYEHFGEKADTENQALVHMQRVRRRKGLLTDIRVVESGEKQRTNRQK
ncbi:hypothetical protein H696_00332 [Fonticula alba]|uniref:Elongation factor-like 1 n=1 Tax=Fonticula alba TaxID=691883 RepID=A0A058ZFP9_FONAL|nr:hypothetical protein H696_00332 [Fonticula alba]KCV72753.1 hypothetical protein H696_00332 [Fonticula alba]|eukprot:XP_009492454.1 hypothetical protein H696_00332 [Fonticula alba]